MQHANAYVSRPSSRAPPQEEGAGCVSNEEDKQLLRADEYFGKEQLSDKSVTFGPCAHASQ
jgi:hypothetical protein